MLQLFKDKLKELEANKPDISSSLNKVRQHNSQITYAEIQAEVTSLHEDTLALHTYDCKCLRIAIAELEREDHIVHAENLINSSLDWDDDDDNIPF
jgi:hypothetical protein